MHVTSENWLDAQNAVLGSALIDERVVPKVMSETTETDYSGPCRNVYNAMRKLFLGNEAVDVVAVASAMGANYRSFLAQLMDITPTAANVDHYIALCKERSRVLELRSVAQDLMQADTLDNARELIERANGVLADNQRGSIADMASAMRSFMERKTTEAKYLTWPIDILNKYLFSKPEDFIILGAEPSVGKTAFALQCAWHWAKEYKVGFFSLETSHEKLFDRLMAYVVGIPMRNIKKGKLTGSEWDRVAAASQQVVARNLELIPASGYTTADIRAKILERGYKLIIVDYLQLVSSRGSGRYEQVTNISIDLHNIAQGLNVMVLALSQLSRSDDNRTPKNSDLRESGQLEQDADVIMMLHLEDKTKPEGNRKLTITKNKEGECRQTELVFDGKCQGFARPGKEKQPEIVQEFLPLPDDKNNPFQ